MINYLLYIFIVFLQFVSLNVEAGDSIDFKTTKWIYQETGKEAQFVLDTLNHSFINDDYRNTSQGANQALIFFNVINGVRKPAGIVKYADRATPALSILGILPYEQPSRERLAFLLHRIIKDKTGIDFDVPLTLMLKLPHNNSTSGNMYAATYQKYISENVLWETISSNVIESIPPSEFQKLVFHIILQSTDAHTGNILLIPFQDRKGGSNFTPALIDLGGNFPRSSTSGPLFGLYGWMMYKVAERPFTKEWKAKFENMNIASIIEEAQLEWQKELDQFGDSAVLPDEIWDLLKLTLHTIKWGAKYKQSLQTMASIFVPIKRISKETGTPYYEGGEIELMIEKYFDPKSKRWARLGEALQELELILSGKQGRRLEQSTNFKQVERCQIHK